MSFATALLFTFFLSVNAQCETRCQATQITNPDPYQQPSPNPYQSTNPDPHQPQPYQALDQSRDDGNVVIQSHQSSTEYRSRTTSYAQSQGQCTEGDMIPNDSDCTSYYECTNGQHELRLCPSGNHFDPSTKSCRADYACLSQAYNPPTTPSPYCNYGELRADDTSCRNYYSCVGDDRHFERRICPEGKTFDRRLNRCVSGSAENKCQQRDSQFHGRRGDHGEQRFRGVGVGLACTESSGPSGYSADPEDCNRFYQCAQGRWVRMSCPSNLVWNPAATVCDWPKNTLTSCRQRM